MKSTVYKSFSSFALLFASAVEFRHSILQQAKWVGFHGNADAISYFLVPLWIAAVLGIWTNRAPSKVFATLGIFLLACHGMVLSAAGNYQSFGILYVLLGAFAGLTAVAGHSIFYSTDSEIDAFPSLERVA